MSVQRLLAKSSRRSDGPEERATLQGHTLTAMRVAKVLVEGQGDTYLQTFGLDPAAWGPRLQEAVIRGAFLHDLGKANHQFQRMLRQGPDPPQALRHEMLSLWIPLRFPLLEKWMFDGCSEVVKHAALFAAAGHHLKFEDGAALDPRPGSEDSEMRVLTGHPDLKMLLEQATPVLGTSSSPPPLQNVNLDLLDSPLEEVAHWLPTAHQWWEATGHQEHRFVPLAKAFVVAADLASSALPRAGKDPVQWAQEVLRRTCSPSELRAITTARLAGKPLWDFQRDVEGSAARVTFVSAGCGTGKTAAAYLWAANRAAGRKLFFCYPTTGTATQGYQDYVPADDLAADGRFAALIHSRAEVDLEDVLAYPGNGDDRLEEAQGVEALSAWDVPLVICTADTVLGLVQNYRRSLFQFPAIASGAFVFDEIHLYDDRMFGSLLRFLETFRGAPVLLMTASLPRSRLEALRRRMGALGEEMAVVPGPGDLEQIKRYHLVSPVVGPPWTEVEAVLREGRKVLWVANAVDRAVGFAREARERGLDPIFPYHSRYRYKDRLDKHKCVVDAFKETTKGPALAITTQVCEVSLDLSADLLVSDLAPVPALIQRLGRLNRRVMPGAPGEPKRAVFLEPESPLPYEGGDLEQARRWLDRLGIGALSQADLARAFTEMAEGPSGGGPTTSAWLDGGPFSAPSSLRDAGVTISVVRGEDAGACRGPGGRVRADQVVRYAVPMPFYRVAKEIWSWPRLGSAFAAPTGRIDYSEEWGATWRA